MSTCGFYVYDSATSDCFLGDMDVASSVADPGDELVTLYAEKCKYSLYFLTF